MRFEERNQILLNIRIAWWNFLNNVSHGHHVQYVVNGNGPKTDPWGTPSFTGLTFDSFTFTNWWRLELVWQTMLKPVSRHLYSLNNLTGYLIIYSVIIYHKIFCYSWNNLRWHRDLYCQYRWLHILHVIQRSSRLNSSRVLLCLSKERYCMLSS